MRCENIEVQDIKDIDECLYGLIVTYDDKEVFHDNVLCMRAYRQKDDILNNYNLDYTDNLTLNIVKLIDGKVMNLGNPNLLLAKVNTYELYECISINSK